MTSNTFRFRGSDRELRARRNRMSCSCVVGFDLSIDQAASRQRRARRCFSVNGSQNIVVNVATFRYTYFFG